MMQKDSKGRKESRAVGGGAQGEEPGKEPGVVEITKGRRGSPARGWAAIPLQRWMPFIRWAPQQLADVTHQFLFLLKRTEKKMCIQRRSPGIPSGTNLLTRQNCSE